VIVAMMAGDMTYQSTYSRLIFVSGLERHLPRVFTHLNPRTRNPVTALLVSGAITSVIIVVVYAQQSLTNAYLTLTGALTFLWLAAGLFFFIPLPLARRRYRERYAERFWRIPGGMAGVWLVILLGLGGTVVGMYYTLTLPYSSDISKGTWIATVGGVSAALVVAGAIIFMFGKRAAEKVSEDETLAQLARLDAPERGTG
jgi:amino acid transporter